MSMPDEAESILLEQCPSCRGQGVEVCNLAHCLRGHVGSHRLSGFGQLQIPRLLDTPIDLVKNLDQIGIY